MKVMKFNTGYLVRLDRDEEVTERLEHFLEERKIRAGTVTGLGGIRDADLGYYDLPSKTYQHKTIPGNLELILYNGNITLLDARPFIHAHAVVSGPDFESRSGHFFRAEVALTGEFVIRPADWEVERLPDDYTGLKLMSLPGEGTSDPP